MVYADYAFYTDVFLGNKIPEADFPRVAERAGEYIDYITIGKAASNADLPAVKKAVCALAELYQANERAEMAAAAAGVSDQGGALSSESVGSWKRSYRSGAELSQQAMELSSQTDQRAYSVASRYLAHTGMLYRGGCRHCSRIR